MRPSETLFPGALRSRSSKAMRRLRVVVGLLACVAAFMCYRYEAFMFTGAALNDPFGGITLYKRQRQECSPPLCEKIIVTNEGDGAGGGAASAKVTIVLMAGPPLLQHSSFQRNLSPFRRVKSRTLSTCLDHQRIF